MISAAQFIAAFPEFNSSPTTSISFWLAQAYSQLDGYRLGVQTDYAAMLFAAHNISLGNQAAMAGAASGQAIGGIAAPIQSKTVGPVSAAYDTTVVSIEGAGQWNATSYGQRLYPLLRGASLGGTYVGAPRKCEWPPTFRPWRGVGF